MFSSSRCLLIFEMVVNEFGLHIHQEQIIIDVTSLKTDPMEIMQCHLVVGMILDTHTVFGPGAKSVSHQNFVLTPTGEKETILARRVNQYFKKRGAHVSLMTLPEHDQIMSVVLGQEHFIAISSPNTLLIFENFSEIKKIGVPTFRHYTL